ncbi:hypothetical protein ACFPM0_07695 [Pseudonocardia sulfidoxydans]|uniref:hypothetical protein n=1 Tax=Pseudonocardia sulfidoxydans TaxID=54011 RepID=UPI00361922D6
MSPESPDSARHTPGDPRRGHATSAHTTTPRRRERTATRTNGDANERRRERTAQSRN